MTHTNETQDGMNGWTFDGWREGKSFLPGTSSILMIWGTFRHAASRSEYPVQPEMVAEWAARGGDHGDGKYTPVIPRKAIEAALACPLPEPARLDV